MYEQRQSARVNYTLLELLYRHRKEELERNYPQVLALLSYHTVGFQAGIDSLRVLSEQDIRLWGWSEDDLEVAYNSSDLIRLTGIDSWFHSGKDAEAMSDRICHFYIPVLSFSLVSDIVRFNDRRPFVRVILQALLQGKRVYALTVGADPYHVLWKREGLHRGTSSMKRELYDQLQQLRSFGIQLINESAVRSVGKQSLVQGRTVLTKEDIEYAHVKGENEIYTASDTIVTALAEDCAREYRIHIVKGNA